MLFFNDRPLPHGLISVSFHGLSSVPVMEKCLFPSLTPTTHKWRRKVLCTGVAECKRCLSKTQVLSPRAFIPCRTLGFCCFSYPNHLKSEFILHWIICSEIKSVQHAGSIRLKTRGISSAVPWREAGRSCCQRISPSHPANYTLFLWQNTASLPMKVSAVWWEDSGWRSKPHRSSV